MSSPAPLIPSTSRRLAPDLQTVFDALCFMQAPININRLAELLGEHRTYGGGRFHSVELRKQLVELAKTGVVRK